MSEQLNPRLIVRKKCLNKYEILIGQSHTVFAEIVSHDSLEIARSAGAESVDGTGWFRGDPKQVNALGQFLRIQSGHGDTATDVDRIVHYSRAKHLTDRALPMDIGEVA